jgi:hypothetical protein
MISLQAHASVAGTVGTIVMVTTKRCRYQVWVTAHAVTVRGPGVDYEIPLDEREDNILFDPDLSAEGTAAMAVIFFEESNQ